MLKVIAYYLPQFHSIPENDAVWGKGFTEWNNVTAAKKLFDKHYQPRVPLNNNYYNLLDEDTILWQTKIAKENSVFGFCIYHYWFSGKLLLNKPLEIIRDSKKIHFPYCICWANESWTDAWTATDKPKSFLEQKYGDEAEWKAHFEYLLTFFKDPDYICENNKPLIVIYRPENIPKLTKRLKYWETLAKKNGFAGLTFAYQQVDFERIPFLSDRKFKYSIEYQPKYALDDAETASYKNGNFLYQKYGAAKRMLQWTIEGIRRKYNVDLIKKRRQRIQKDNKNDGPTVIPYSDLGQKMIEFHNNNEKSVAGIFVGYDDTPRKNLRGTVIQSTPDEFRKLLFSQVKNVKKNYSNDYLFVFAWNEWAEGGYLEPDNQYGYEYLNAIRDAVVSYENMD